MFLGSASGIADGNPATAATQLESDQIEAALGTSVAGAGDVNADGYADVIVGAPSFGAGEVDEGAAFVFLGSASGIADGDSLTAAGQLESDQASAALGTSVAAAGDVNGDGYADVIVGAPGYDDAEAEEGAAFVFSGRRFGCRRRQSPDGGDPTGVEPGERGSWARVSAGAGDVDADGYADVIVGARYYSYDAGEVDEGAAFVFLGDCFGHRRREPRH